MLVIFNDGGRAAAGYKGHTGDCVARSIAIATGKPYQEIYDRLAHGNASQRKSKRASRVTGIRTAARGISTKRKWFKDYMAELGFTWTPTLLVGSSQRTYLREQDLPKGILVVSVPRHYVAVIDGVIHDTYNSAKEGRVVVRGFYTLQQKII